MSKKAQDIIPRNNRERLISKEKYDEILKTIGMKGLYDYCQRGREGTTFKIKCIAFIRAFLPPYENAVNRDPMVDLMLYDSRKRLWHTHSVVDSRGNEVTDPQGCKLTVTFADPYFVEAIFIYNPPKMTPQEKLDHEGYLRYYGLVE